MAYLACLRLCLAAGMAAGLLAHAWPAAAQDAPLPPNTLPCEAFAKRGDGVWVAKKPVTMDVGKAKGLTLDPGEVTPKSQNLGGIDLYVLLEAKCGKIPA